MYEGYFEMQYFLLLIASLLLLIYSSLSMHEILLTTKPNDTDANWFWRLTTKPYFFPLFYTSLALILSIIDGLMRKEGPTFEVFFYALGMMPQGLGFLALWAGLIDFVQDIPPIYLIFHPLLFLSIFVINYYKSKKRIILKWLIITWLLLIILSFGGCLTMAGAHM